MAWVRRGVRVSYGPQFAGIFGMEYVGSIPFIYKPFSAKMPCMESVRSKFNEGVVFANKHTRTVLVGLVILTVGISLIFTPQSLASMAVFYPGACQGGWTNPNNASQGPTVDDLSPASFYTASNSAVLDSSHGNLVCGTFFGAIPSGSVPKDFNVKMHWSFDNGSIVHDGTVQDSAPSSDVTVPSLDDASGPDTTSDVTPPADATTVTTPPPASTDSSPGDASGANAASSAPSSTDTVTTTDPSGGTVTIPSLNGDPASVSSDQTSTPTPTPTTDATPPPASADASAPVPAATPDTSADQSASAPAAAAPVPAEVASSLGALVVDGGNDADIIAPGTAVLDVRYTLDGTTWTTIGTVDATNWQSANFVIDDPSVQTWGDLSKLQIGLFSDSQTAQQPAVYVDSMEIDVDYADAASTSVPTIEVSDPSIAIVTPDKAEFSLDESPTFSVQDPGLSADDIQSLVASDKATVLDDQLGVFGASIDPTAAQNAADQNSTPSGTGTSANSSALSAPVVIPAASDASATVSSVTTDASAPDTTSDVAPPADTTTPSPDSTDSSSDASSPVPTAAPDTSTDTAPAPTTPAPDDSSATPDVSSLAGAFAAGAPIFDTPLVGDATDLQQAAYVPKVKVSGRSSFVRAIETTKLFLYRTFTSASVMARSLQAFVGDTPPPVIDAVVLDAQGQETTIETSVQHVVAGGVEKDQIVVDKPERMFRPGKYTLKVTLHTLEANIVSEQDFSWGVLAINTDKTVYDPGDTAYVQMGVINDLGHTVCDAAMTMTVTAPDGSSSNYSTADGSIVQDPECGPDNFISVPDYYAHVPVGTQAGTYGMTLTATTDNGPRTVYNEFQVDPSVAFSVIRSGPTRIYPVDPYPMKIDITPTADWSGTVVETMPSVFTPIVSDPSYPPYTADTVGDSTTLTWNLSLHAGVATTIGYDFLAPPISPEFYLLGPLSFYAADADVTTATPVFQETRRWQIADDATCAAAGTGSGNWSDAATWSCGHVPSSSDSATINSGVTVTLDASEPSSGSIQGVVVNGTLNVASNQTLSTTTLSIGSAGAMSANAAGITLTGTSGTLLSLASGGSFTAGTSTVTMTGAASSMTLNSTGFVGANALYNLTINNGAVSDAFVLGDALTVTNATTITTGTLDTSATGNYAFTSGTVSVGASSSAGFAGNASTITLNGATGPLFTVGAGSATTTASANFVVASNADVTFTSGSVSLNNLTFAPVLSASHTYTLASTALTFGSSSNVTVNPSAASGNPTLTVNMGVAISLPGTSSVLLIEGSGGAFGKLDTTSSNYALSMGSLDIESAGTLFAEGSAVTLVGTSGNLMTDNGSLNSGTSTFTVTGAGSTTLNATNFTGGNKLYNLTLNTGGNTAALGGNLTVGNALVITASTFNTSASGNYALMAGTISESASASSVLALNASTVTLTGTSGTLLTAGAGSTFTAGTSTVVFSPNASVTLTSGTVAFYNATLSPALTGAATYTSAASATCTNAFLSSPISASGTQTLTLAGTMSFGSGCTFTVGGDGSTTTSLSANLSAGALSIQTAGILSAGTTTDTFSSTAGTTILALAGSGQFNGGTSTVTVTSLAASVLASGFTGTNAFYNLTLNPASTEAYTLGGATAVSHTLTDTLGTLDTSGSNYALSAGTISIAATANAGMNFEASTVTLTGTSGTLLTRGAGSTMSSNSANVTVTSNASVTIFSGAMTFTNFTMSPTLSASATYTMGTAPTINGNVTSFPISATPPTTYTLTLPLLPTLATTATLLVNGDTYTTSSLGANNIAGVGFVDIEAGGLLAAGTSNITVTGATAGNLWKQNGVMTGVAPGTVIFNGAALSGTTVFDVGTNVSFPGNVTINNASFTAPMGANATIAAAGTLTITNGTFDTNATGNYSLSVGFVTIANSVNAKILAEGSTITLTGVTTVGSLLSKGTGGSGIWTQGTSTVVIASASGSPNIVNINWTFYNLFINPGAAGAAVINETAAAGTTTLTITNKLDIQSGVLSEAIAVTSGAGATFEIDSGASYCLGGPTNGTLATCAGTEQTLTSLGAMPTFATYVFDPASTVRIVANAAVSLSPSPVYGNLILSPTMTGGQTYNFLNAGVYVVKGNFFMTPTAPTGVTLAVGNNGAGFLTVYGTIKEQPSGSALVVYDPYSAASQVVSAASLDLEANSTFSQSPFGGATSAPLYITGNVIIAASATMVTGSTNSPCSTQLWSSYIGGSLTNNGTMNNRTCADITFNGPNISVISGSGTWNATTNMVAYLAILPSTLFPYSSVTISNASPAVITTAQLHGLAVNDTVSFSSTGALPTGLTTGTTYYVVSQGFTPASFEVSTTVGGVPVNTSSAGSGTFSIARVANIGKEVDFAAGNTYSIGQVGAAATAAGFTVAGHGGKLVKLASTSPGTTWTLIPPVTAANSVTFADVQDSFCSNNVSANHQINATSSTDDGNNSLAPTSSGCWSFGKPYINFQLSANAVDFGPLTLSGSRYGTPITGLSGSGGSGTDTSDTTSSSAYATVATSAGTGYTLYVQGASLVNPLYSYILPGMSLGTPSPGTDQFGMRLVASGGSGTVTSPYNTSQFAYTGNATTPVAVASLSSSSLRTTTYFMHYVADISGLAPVGNYSTTLTYLVVPNF